MVLRLDRLARSVAHLLEIVARLEAKKVGFRILNIGIDTNTASGKLVLHVLGAIGEFERSFCWSVSARGSPRQRLKQIQGQSPDGASQGSRGEAFTSGRSRSCRDRTSSRHQSSQCLSRPCVTHRAS